MVRELKKKLEEIEGHTFWFMTTDDARSAIQATKDLIAVEEKALKDIKFFGGKVPMKQEELPPMARFFNK